MRALRDMDNTIYEILGWWENYVIFYYLQIISLDKLIQSDTMRPVECGIQGTVVHILHQLVAKYRGNNVQCIECT